jgi:hypothetical protein
MSAENLLESLPIWSLLLGTAIIVVLAIYGGLGIARLQRMPQDKQAEGAIGAVVGAALGLLAFMLAFTFSLAADRRDLRRELLLNEVNSIGTTHLRAGLLPEPHRKEVRRLIGRYVDIRVDVGQHPDKLAWGINESNTIQGQLWQHAEALADLEHPKPEIVALFIDSLNETLDLQTKRLTVGQYRIPVVVWVVLGVLTTVSMMVVGYHFGRSSKGNVTVNCALAICFALVISLIVDVDRGAAGLLNISNEPMVELQAKLEAQFEAPGDRGSRHPDVEPAASQAHARRTSLLMGDETTGSE